MYLTQTTEGRKGQFRFVVSGCWSTVVGRVWWRREACIMTTRKQRNIIQEGK